MLCMSLTFYAPIDGRFLIGSEVSLISGSFKLPKIQLTSRHRIRVSVSVSGRSSILHPAGQTLTLLRLGGRGRPRENLGTSRKERRFTSCGAIEQSSNGRGRRFRVMFGRGHARRAFGIRVQSLLGRGPEQKPRRRSELALYEERDHDTVES